MRIPAGSINVSVYYYIQQDASGTSPGEPVTGLLFSDIETGGSASYARQGGARVDLTLITLASASTAHADGGFILVDDTNMPGLYRCDYPDAAFAIGVDQVFTQIVVAAANNAVATPVLVDLVNDAVLDTGTAAAIADGSITLQSGHGITDTTVMVYLLAGTNAVGKSRIATFSAGDLFTVDPAWNGTVNGNVETTPSGAISYAVVPIPPSTQTNLVNVNVGTVAAGAIDGYKVNTAAIVDVTMVLTSDHVSRAPGLTVVAQISKDGGAFATAAGTMVEVSNGVYHLSATAADMNAVDLVFRFTSATADPVEIQHRTYA